MPRAVHPSIIDFNRRKANLPIFELVLEGCEESIQVPKEFDNLLEGHLERRQVDRGQRGSMKTLWSLWSLL